MKFLKENSGVLTFLFMIYFFYNIEQFNIYNFKVSTVFFLSSLIVIFLYWFKLQK
jgi:hypothetical protein